MSRSWRLPNLSMPRRGADGRLQQTPQAGEGPSVLPRAERASTDLATEDFSGPPTASPESLSAAGSGAADVTALESAIGSGQTPTASPVDGASGTVAGADTFRFTPLAPTSTTAPAVAIDDLPPALQGLAKELDRLWGDSDGSVSVAELDRVAKYVLAALPFFTKEASAILELADALGFTKEPETQTTLNSIREGLGQMDASEVAHGKTYRAFLDAAIEESDRTGSPELIRTFAAHNPRYHRLSILEHTAAAVLSIRTLSHQAGIEWKEAGAVMLLHDVGKILSRNIRPPFARLLGDDKNWNFSGHEALGADWLKARGLKDDLVAHVRTHGDLRTMGSRAFKTMLQGPQKTLQEFFLVSLADLLAKGDSPALIASANATKPRFQRLARAAGVDFDKMWGAYEASRTQWFATAPPQTSSG